jgi:iron complex outermembrane receptor protein
MGNKYAFHWGAILLAVLSVSAAAETEKSSDPGEVFQIQEVVVTAQKRQQNLQDVPIAISALGAQKISDARIDKVEDISALAPNVITLPQIGGNQLAGFSIRGIVASNSAPESDNPVSIYVEGVYLGRPAGAVFEFTDMDLLEMLVGPQGKLFGRNSTGGAINIITADPAGKLGGRIDGTISNYSGRRFRARFDTPEWAGLSAQFNYFHNEHDGDVRNLGAGTTWDFTNATNGRRSTYTAGQTLGSDDTNAYRVALRFHPSDEFNILYKYDRTENHGVPAATGSRFLLFLIYTQ